MAHGTSDKEEEFFARQELERRVLAEHHKQEKLKTAERDQLRKLHHMHCPKCGMALIEIDYKGIKVDECSECKGLWLDAHELDAILALEKSALAKLMSIFSR